MTDYATSTRQHWIFNLQPRRPWPEWLELVDIALYGVLLCTTLAVLILW